MDERIQHNLNPHLPDCFVNCSTIHGDIFGRRIFSQDSKYRMHFFESSMFERCFVCLLLQVEYSKIKWIHFVPPKVNRRCLALGLFSLAQNADASIPPVTIGSKFTESDSSICSPLRASVTASYKALARLFPRASWVTIKSLNWFSALPSLPEHWKSHRSNSTNISPFECSKPLD